MNRSEIMKEYQQKLEGIYRKNYTIATPLLQAYDKQHALFDSMDLRLQTINHMDREGSIIPKDTLEYISNQLSSISANYSLEEQASFLRNESRGLKMQQEAISIPIPDKVGDNQRYAAQEQMHSR